MAALPVWIQLLLSFFAGLLLGTFFFSGLWWTAQRLATVKYPVLLALASFLVRTAVVLGGFYLLISGGLPRLAAALAGFVVVRLASLIIARPHKNSDANRRK